MEDWSLIPSCLSQSIVVTKSRPVNLTSLHGVLSSSLSQVDKFSIEAVDLGQVFKIRIRHDNSEFMGSDWYLDQVEVMDMETEEVYMFLCERWLSKKKEDKRIERTFYIKVTVIGFILQIFSHKAPPKQYPELLALF